MSRNGTRGKTVLTKASGQQRPAQHGEHVQPQPLPGVPLGTGCQVRIR